MEFAKSRWVFAWLPEQISTKGGEVMKTDQQIVDNQVNVLALAQAMTWLDFPELREFRRVIHNGPTDLRDALDAAFAVLEDPSKVLTAEQVTELKEHTGSWFGAAHEVRRLLLALKVG